MVFSFQSSSVIFLIKSTGSISISFQMICFLSGSAFLFFIKYKRLDRIGRKAHGLYPIRQSTFNTFVNLQIDIHHNLMYFNLIIHI